LQKLSGLLFFGPPCTQYISNIYTLQDGPRKLHPLIIAITLSTINLGLFIACLLRTIRTTKKPEIGGLQYRKTW